MCVCLCIAQNELICGYASVVYTLSSFRLHTHTHCDTHTRMHTRACEHTHTHCDTHIPIPFENRKPTGLKVDIANLNSHQQWYDFYKFKQIPVNKKSHIHKTNMNNIRKTNSKMTPHYHLEKEGNQKLNL